MPRIKKSLLETIPMLIILGLLAGALGGVGVGLIQYRALTSTATAPPK
jgi:hypothetical protein